MPGTSSRATLAVTSLRLHALGNCVMAKPASDAVSSVSGTARLTTKSEFSA